MCNVLLFCWQASLNTAGTFIVSSEKLWKSLLRIAFSISSITLGICLILFWSNILVSTDVCMPAVLLVCFFPVFTWNRHTSCTIDWKRRYQRDGDFDSIRPPRLSAPLGLKTQPSGVFTCFAKPAILTLRAYVWIYVRREREFSFLASVPPAPPVQPQNHCRPTCCPSPTPHSRPAHCGRRCLIPACKQTRALAHDMTRGMTIEHYGPRLGGGSSCATTMTLHIWLHTAARFSPARPKRVWFIDSAFQASLYHTKLLILSLGWLVSRTPPPPKI